jgi:hypothetical protein
LTLAYTHGYTGTMTSHPQPIADPDIKAEVLVALRSDRFRQGEGYLAARRPLRTDEPAAVQHCCLGVMCEIAVEHGVIERREVTDNLGSHFVYGTPEELAVEDGKELPASVRAWLGWNDIALGEVPVTVANTLGNLDRDALWSAQVDGKIGPDLDLDDVPGECLAELNDAGVPFDTIAQVIEATL